MGNHIAQKSNWRFHRVFMQQARFEILLWMVLKFQGACMGIIETMLSYKDNAIEL